MVVKSARRRLPPRTDKVTRADLIQLFAGPPLWTCLCLNCGNHWHEDTNPKSWRSCACGAHRNAHWNAQLQGP